MIDRVYTGYDPGGLIQYLFGPGRYDEHENPRVLASWDAQPDLWQPPKVGPGEFDLDVRALVAAMQAPAKGAGLPVTTPNPELAEHARFFTTLPDGSRSLKEGYVWHCTLRNDSSDRTLSDDEWAHIAEEMMHRSGVARRGDVGGPRWVAVRHDDDGIHLVATLVRQDTHRRFSPSFYKKKLRDAALEMEQLYGLTSTAPADRTAASCPHRGETEKAARSGRVPAREELRDAVAQAASASLTVAEFEQALSQAGYRVELRRLPSGDVQGYKVARPGDVNRHGNPVWYSGSTLAADLSLPKLEQRWQQARRGRRPGTALDAGMSGQEWAEHGEVLVERTRLLLLDDPSQVHGVAHAVGDVWAALDRGEGRLVSGPGARWDRVARQPHQPVPETQHLADELRWLARGLGSTNVPSLAALHLGMALAALALQIASLLGEGGRPPAQVRAARQTSRLAGQPETTRRPTPQPTRPVARPEQRRSRARRLHETAVEYPRGGRSLRRDGPPQRPGRPEPDPGPSHEPKHGRGR